MKNDQERIYWLAWLQIQGIGSTLLNRIQLHFSNLKTAWESPINELLKIDGIGTRLIEIIQAQKSKIEPEKFFFQHIEKNPLFLLPIDDKYPRLLLEIPSFPAILYYQGNVDFIANADKKALIAIIGTRKPTDHGRKWTYNISKTLAKNNFSIISGLAAGIDAIAHQGCLDAQGETIAVLGNSLDIAYPSENTKLYQQIKEKGLILSEYPVTTTPNASHFPARNRIVAGLSRAILVMEAPEKSGALITARLGNEFGRDIYTLPNSPDNLQSRGCLRLIHKGAEVIITEEELLKVLGVIPNLDQSQLSMFETVSNTNPNKDISLNVIPKLEPSLAKVFAVITDTAMIFDEIVAKSELTSGQVSGILLELELEGLITQLPGMRYQKGTN